MESLEERKAKFQAHLKKAQALDDDEHMAAVKEYRLALKYCIHKSEAEKINQKIIKLKNVAGHVSGMLDDRRASGLPKWVLGLIIMGLMTLCLLVIFFVVKPFG